METPRIITAIEKVKASRRPVIEFIRGADAKGSRPGIFASSFNPPTLAHAELMRRASLAFSLDETVALAGVANADKDRYESSLEDRLSMLDLAFEHDRSTSVGLSSHAYFVDLLDALALIYPEGTDLHFIVGFDTFERVLDPEGRYTGRYHRNFAGREQALGHLLAHSRLIVAGRKGAGEAEVRALLAGEPVRFADRILYLDFPADLGERSATEVRELARAGGSVEKLVPPAVAQYIRERGLYK
ncbi:MAG TPA: nicotinate-nicotinamide nucleotide adenylyltransferase [Blastocatellia bacterium]|nr:nicotinate-nicotinamide nucleotide adenylyltransferase [Blastocatellia bacterium]